MRSRSTHQANNVTSIQKHPQAQELRTDLWDERYSQKEREKLAVVAQQYGLDPMTKEVMILRGNIYVTASGLQKLALQDPEYNGCEIELVQTDWANNFFVVKARIWKKGCEYPFEDYGDADPTTSNMRGHALFRHAITRARARAMRSAFAIPFCSLEELDDETRWRKASEGNKRPKTWKGREKTPAAAGPDGATEQQHAMLAKYRKELTLEEEAFVALLEELFQVQETGKLSRFQCSQLLDELSQRKVKANKAAKANDEPKPAKAEQKVDAPKKVVDAPKKAADVEEAVAPAPIKPGKKSSAVKAQVEDVEEPEEQLEMMLVEEVEEPVVEEPTARKSKPKSKARTTSTLPRWTVEEQKRIADDLVERMRDAKSLKELKREWELFQGVRHQLSEEWFAQICETKEARKAALVA